MITSRELRQKFLDFFASKGHTIISSASLIPENDPTALFTTAGMHPLVPYLLGEEHPGGSRLADAQKCIRTGDIDEVGDSTHHTFFEMLGNWSLGDYFKSDSIKYSFEFLTSSDWLNIDVNRLAVSVFVGDDDAPFDAEAHDLWLGLGIPEKRIARLPKKNNWWDAPGVTGPCGPDTEIFYWVGDPNQVPESFNDDNDLWVEIWNNVFMQYNKKIGGGFEPLAQKNVDTGMGMERVLAVLNDSGDNYRTELFVNLISKIEELSGQKYGLDASVTRMMRIVADHLKAATFIIGDDKGISPSNTDQGYIVRRLMRRTIRLGRQLGIKEESWTHQLAQIVIGDYADVYGELKRNQSFILEQFNKEEEKFNRTLENGLKEFAKLESSNIISGVEAFNLFQSYGFPLEMTEELAIEKGLTVDKLGFEAELKKHQDLSRTASAGKFKGGLADSGDETTKLHTAAHLLLAALRKVLGDHVVQRGSNITPERLRLDFSHADKMTDDQIKTVEDLVNIEIQKSLPVICEQMPLSEAKDKGAMGVFESKYGEEVKVYKIGEDDSIFSYEICGGPHVENISVLGHFRILKEESSSSGVRRIKAILE
ncbi:MAG: alanine--tRNA ligase [Patescibacteria group bacterium]